MDIWLIIAVAAASGAVFGLLSALSLLAGVVGVAVSARRGHHEHAADIASLNERVTKLFKQRAADASIVARIGGGTLKEDAEARLEGSDAPATSDDPRRIPLGFLRR